MMAKILSGEQVDISGSEFAKGVRSENSHAKPSNGKAWLDSLPPFAAAALKELNAAVSECMDKKSARRVSDGAPGLAPTVPGDGTLNFSLTDENITSLLDDSRVRVSLEICQGLLPEPKDL